MINGVECKALETHSDSRGFFREIIRASDPFFAEGFGQWSHSLMFNGVIKAWHFHHKQTDWWYVATGVLRVGLHDLREDSPTYGETMDFFDGRPATRESAVHSAGCGSRLQNCTGTGEFVVCHLAGIRHG